MAGILTDSRGGWPSRRLGLLVLGLIVVAAGLGFSWASAPGAAPGVGPGGSAAVVRILGAEPLSYDPAFQSDVSGAAVAAQLFEGLTAFDSSLTLQPALARAWEVVDGGRRVVFHLRSGLTFSDGTPLGAQDVVRSWLRVIDPARPSPLASLMSDVVGADDYRTGRVREPSRVGLSADATSVTVRLLSPAADFPSIVAAGPFAVVPPGVTDGSALVPGRFIGSGGYVLSAVGDTELTMRANPRYWAGPPAIGTVRLVTDLRGRSPVTAFEERAVDYTGVGLFDASWIRYDRTLGPQLREVPSLSVEYVGFDTSRPPFNDVRVRRAVAAGVDWRRVVTLAGPGDESPASGLVPPGIPGRSATDFLPPFQLDQGRTLLSDAGFPAGRGFQAVTLGSGGTSYGEAIQAAIETGLGIRVDYETMVGDDYYSRLTADPPHIWTLGWVADYPGPNDFLGVLLHSTSVNNVGRWRSDEFDGAIADAGAASDTAAAAVAFERAQAIVRRDVPVIPLAYAGGWALARSGLLGAAENGLGMLRFAGLAWSG